MFISKGCLTAILENLSVLNREVEELKKATNFDNKSKQVANKSNLTLENQLKSH